MSPIHHPERPQNATGIDGIATISTALVNGVGFSNGCALLALNAPHRRTSGLIDSPRRHPGPPMRLAAPDRVKLSYTPVKLLTTPRTSRSAWRGNRMRRPAHQVNPEVIPEAPVSPREGERGPRRVTIVGKPNVGKSSLLNKLAGQQRVVVDEVAGTTVDPVDELVEVGGEIYRFIDTAGIRRRVKEASGHEYYASLRTHGAIERAEVCIVVVDASEPVTEQDLRILTSVEEAGRALVIAFNKWDLTDDERRRYLRREIERDLVQFDWAAKINISALTGRHVDRLGLAIKEALAGWETRISTGRLNAFLGRIVAAHPHPVRGGKQPRILFATQARAAPPTFVMFTTGQLEPGYVRF